MTEWKEKVENIDCVCGINVFNNELTIYACLQQAIKNFDSDKILVFDDGSSDNTILYIEKFNKENNTNIAVYDVGAWDPWPNVKAAKDHDKNFITEGGSKSHAKSKFKSWYLIKEKYPDAIYFSLEADVILVDNILHRAKDRISKWDDPDNDSEWFNIVFTIDDEYVRPMCSTEDSLEDKLPGITQRKIYDQSGDWNFACFWTGGKLQIGPDPVWPYGACLYPWLEKNQIYKKGQDIDTPYAFHLYCYNNNKLDSDFSKSLILKIDDLNDLDVDWSILGRVWYPKILKLNPDTLKRYVKEDKQ